MLICCQLTGFLQPEQNSSLQEGHWTGHSAACRIALSLSSFDEDDGASAESDVQPTKHTVSQPALGHQVRNLSNSISVIRQNTKKNN